MDRYNLGLRIRKLCNDGIPVTELLTKKMGVKDVIYLMIRFNLIAYMAEW